MELTPSSYDSKLFFARLSGEESRHLSEAAMNYLLRSANPFSPPGFEADPSVYSLSATVVRYFSKRNEMLQHGGLVTIKKAQFPVLEKIISEAIHSPSMRNEDVDSSLFSHMREEFAAAQFADIEPHDIISDPNI